MGLQVIVKYETYTTGQKTPSDASVSQSHQAGYTIDWQAKWASADLKSWSLLWHYHQRFRVIKQKAHMLKPAVYKRQRMEFSFKSTLKPWKISWLLKMHAYFLLRNFKALHKSFATSWSTQECFKSIAFIRVKNFAIILQLTIFIMSASNKS